MMVMEAIVRLQEEEKKELGFLGKEEEEKEASVKKWVWNLLFLIYKEG